MDGVETSLVSFWTACWAFCWGLLPLGWLPGRQGCGFPGAGLASSQLHLPWDSRVCARLTSVHALDLIGSGVTSPAQGSLSYSMWNHENH